jgi:signal transduction histidine kinase/DNA-binding response OmpR family regulator
MAGIGRKGRPRQVRSLRIRFVLAIAALVALVLVANSLVLALANRPRLREDLEHRAEAFARLSVAQICNAYETYYASGYSKFREIVQDEMKLDPDLARLAIYDTAGRVLFDSRELRSELVEPVQRNVAPAPAGGAPKGAPAGAAAGAVAGMPPGALPGSGERLLTAVQGLAPSAWPAEDGRAYVVMAPYVEEWGRHRYSVAFTFSYDSLRLAALSAGWRIFWLSAGSLALGVLIAILLAAQSVRPIEVLTRGAQDLADGQLGRRIELATGDEFGVLAATFNQMAEKLARTISDLETSNRTLGQMNLELQQLDRMKSDLLANVSHELRTPLTAIQGYTEAMDEGLLGSVNDQQRSALNVVQRNSRRLMGMIEQLLAFSRLDALEAPAAPAALAALAKDGAPGASRLPAAGMARLDLEAFDLVELAEQVVGSVRAGHGPALDLRLEVAAGEGGETEEAGEAGPAGGAGGSGGAAERGGRGLPLVWGDPGRIAEVLENLVTNAVKFTPPGGEVRVRLSRRGDEVEVAVADRGIGIPAAAHAKIFERFYQLDTSSTRAYGGMGLGLAIVREILAAHHREIQVESEEGKGATFRFSLPLAAPAAAVPERVAGKRIALIDDDTGFAQLLAGFLERAGFAVEVSPTARAGFERVVAAPPDLVLLDRLLPDGDGFDLLSRLRQDERTAGIPVLVVSVRKERALGLRLGASGYLVKPVRPARVQELILETLGQPRSAAGAAGAAGAADGAADRVPEVLVVDDDDDLRHLLVERLQAGGLVARGAADGGEALALIAARRPALVLLDLMMPGVDGWETLRRLRADPATAELPVVVLSARDGAAERAAGEDLHVMDFVGKPFDLGTLLEDIERMLGAASPAESPAGLPNLPEGPAGDAGSAGSAGYRGGEGAA